MEPLDDKVNARKREIEEGDKYSTYDHKADTFDWDVHPYAPAGRHPSHTHACVNTNKLMQKVKTLRTTKAPSM